jgi:hypothetical protein
MVYYRKERHVYERVGGVNITLFARAKRTLVTYVCESQSSPMYSSPRD